MGGTVVQQEVTVKSTVGPMQLFLLRHAKSSWDDPSLDDHDRPLAPRGRRAAARVAELFRAEGTRPALVLCSSARRARETAQPIADAMVPAVELQVDGGLYGASAAELLERLREVAPSVGPVLVVAHNPGLQDLALGLAGDGDEDAMASLGTKFPTAALACLETGTANWAGLTWGCAYLVRLVVPRAL
jgi:phosphohistidine phosphatase